MYSTSDGAIFISVGNGNWNDVTAWQQDSTFTPALRTPQGGDTVIIKSGNTITINNQYDFSGQAPMYIQIEGILEFDTGKKLKLAAGSGVKLVDAGSIVIPGTGGGNSNIIEIGGTVLWKSGDGPLSGPSDLGTTPTFPLPVTWVSVKVVNSESINSVQWITSDEEFTSHFVVQRSQDLISWTAIAEVLPSENGYYNLIDNEYREGFNYYRIVHIENGGVKNFSKIVNIFNEKSLKSQIRLYPNPTVSNIHLKGLEDFNTEVRILSMDGKSMNPKTVQNFDELIIDVHTLQTGTYIMNITGTGIQESIPFIKK